MAFDFVLDENGKLVDAIKTPAAGKVVGSIHGAERNGWWHRSQDNANGAIYASVEAKFGVPPFGTTPMPLMIRALLAWVDALRATNRWVEAQEISERIVERVDYEPPFPDAKNGVQVWGEPKGQVSLSGCRPGRLVGVESMPMRRSLVQGP